MEHMVPGVYRDQCRSLISLTQRSPRKDTSLTTQRTSPGVILQSPKFRIGGKSPFPMKTETEEVKGWTVSRLVTRSSGIILSITVSVP